METVGDEDGADDFTSRQDSTAFNKVQLADWVTLESSSNRREQKMEMFQNAMKIVFK